MVFVVVVVVLVMAVVMVVLAFTNRGHSSVTQLVRTIRVSDTACCKDEFRRNLPSHR